MYWSCLFNGINGISAIFCTINDIKLSIDHNPDTSDTYFIFIHGLQSRKEIFSHIIKKLNEKYNDEQINKIFNQKPEQIIEDTQFASKFCEKIIE